MNRLVALLAGFCLLLGCGGVGVEENQQLPALRLIHLYPRDGESGVPKDVKVLAHFSDDVFSTSNCDSSDIVNNETFFLAPCDNLTATVSAEIGCFQFFADNGETVLDVNLAIAVLSPQSSLDGGIRYCLTLESSIHGLNTDPLGASIKAAFTTKP